VDEVARMNLAAVRKVRPHGPYRLLGYSNGGVIAFEMARSLLEQGETVEELVLLDSLCPPQRTSSEIELVVEVFSHVMETLGGKLEVDIGELAAVPRAERGEYLYRLMDRHGLALDKEYFINSYNVATASEALCRAHQLAALPRAVDVTLFRAIDAYPGAPADYGWNRYLAKPLRVHDVAANHFSIIAADAAGVVAGVINDAAGPGVLVAESAKPAAGRGAKRTKTSARRRAAPAGAVVQPVELES